MKKHEVKVGQVYTAKVSDKLVPIRIDREHPRAGWNATNLRTNRPVHIKSAQRLRSEVKTGTSPAAAADAPAPSTAVTKEPVKKKVSAAERRARAAAERKRPLAAATNDATATSDEAATTPAEAKPSAKRNTKAKAKPAADGTKRVSLLDAAALVLAEANEPLNATQMVEQVIQRGLWTPRTGKTPAATLYAAITREIATKAATGEARFQKVDRGRFAASGKER